MAELGGKAESQSKAVRMQGKPRIAALTLSVIWGLMCLLAGVDRFRHARDSGHPIYAILPLVLFIVAGAAAFPPIVFWVRKLNPFYRPLWMAPVVSAGLLVAALVIVQVAMPTDLSVKYDRDNAARQAQEAAATKTREVAQSALPAASTDNGRSVGDRVTDALVDPGMNAITAKVARDAVDQYNMAVTSGDRMEICVHAGVVAATYLQAKNQENYLIWKGIQRRDCRNAGLPQ